MATSKHAYLIIAHKNATQINRLLSLIDDERNDIYLHINKNVKLDISEIKPLKKSKLYIYKKNKIVWGSDSIMKTEFFLFEKAKEHDKYRYYHLLSGQDLPLKSQDEIHYFFKKNDGKEFVKFDGLDFHFEERIKYYYPITSFLGKPTTFLKKVLYAVEKVFIIFQKIFGINRIKKFQSISFQKGSTWFSITDSLVEYILSNKQLIEKMYKQTFIPDEIYLQTLVFNSKFKKNVYDQKFDNKNEAISRYIDWNRGKPYTFKEEDFSTLIESNCMFARKFDVDIDEKIVEKIWKYLNGRGE
jgi:hypothetical protein